MQGNVIRKIGQAVCIFAIALGAGLFSFGGYLDPRVDVKDPSTIARQIDPYRASEEHFTASICRGVGVGFLTLGSLGLIVPWINVFVLRSRAQEPSPATSNPT